jgi:hypothetical protein
VPGITTKPGGAGITRGGNGTFTVTLTSALAATGAKIVIKSILPIPIAVIIRFFISDTSKTCKNETYLS